MSEKFHTRHEPAHSAERKGIKAEVALQMENPLSGNITKRFKIHRSQRASTGEKSLNVVVLRPEVVFDPFVPIVAIGLKPGFIR